MVVVMKIWV